MTYGNFIIEFLYKGKITRIERYGAFVSLNNNVWGLMRGDVSDYNVGEDIIVFITAIKSREGKIDFAPAYVESYNLKRLTKSIPRTLSPCLSTAINTAILA